MIPRKLKIQQVISGGQTGADLGGLEAAKQCGFKTGGWMPFGFKNELGSQPHLKELYGMREHESPNYPPRTEANVMDADCTLRFATDFESPGEYCTWRFIRLHRKPYYDVNPFHEHSNILNGLLAFLRRTNPRVINVAGNRESMSPGLQEVTRKLLVEAFTILK